MKVPFRLRMRGKGRNDTITRLALSYPDYIFLIGWKAVNRVGWELEFEKPFEMVGDYSCLSEDAKDAPLFPIYARKVQDV